MKIIKKAWILNFENISDGFLISEKVCFAGSRNKAKIELLKEVKYDDLIFTYTKEPVTYLNIPVKRAKEYDKVLFEGEEVSRFEIGKILEKRAKRKKLQDILDDEKVTHCFIMKRGNYYCEGKCGYTSNIFDAGVYKKRDAVSEAWGIDGVSIKIINIDEYHNLVKAKIEKLNSKLLSTI